MSTVMLNDVRLAFPSLFKATSFKPEDPKKYGATFLLEPDSENVKKVKKAMVAAAEEKWPGKGVAMVKQLVAGNRVCLRSGDEKSDYDGFEGMVFVSTNNPKRPTVFDRDRTPLAEEDGRIYAGCYVNARVEVWAQDSHQWGKRLNASVIGVQFVRDGEPFGGGAAPATADDFPELEDAPAADAGDDWGGEDDDIPF